MGMGDSTAFSSKQAAPGVAEVPTFLAKSKEMDEVELNLSPGGCWVGLRNSVKAFSGTKRGQSRDTHSQ